MEPVRCIGTATFLSSPFESPAIWCLLSYQSADSCKPQPSNVVLVDGTGGSQCELLLCHHIVVGCMAGMQNGVQHQTPMQHAEQRGDLFWCIVAPVRTCLGLASMKRHANLCKKVAYTVSRQSLRICSCVCDPASTASPEPAYGP